MHPVTELETSVPAFLGKLWKLVEDPKTDDLICWAPNGCSFFIRNQAQFARELLPHYYKHNNMASFVRQLNMYGFHKKVSVEYGGLKCDRDEMEFAHQYFVKGHPYLLEHIKRKIASAKSQDSSHPPMKQEMMNKVLSEVRTMRGRQEHLDTRLGAMKRENEALWRELAMLRRKHLKQQEIVNKLIHFLVTLVQPARSGGLPVKRRYPLMIDNANHVRNKRTKMSKPEASPTGPVIHELELSEHDIDPEYITIDMFGDHSDPAIESPRHDEYPSTDIENLETVEMMENAIRHPEEAYTLRRQVSQRIKPQGKKKEETLMVEMSGEEDSSVPTVATESIARRTKPVPIKTLRSSKLAAMAANINKMNENEDLDSSQDMDESKNDESEMVRLEDIFVLPDEINRVEDDEIERTSGADDAKTNGGSNFKNVLQPANCQKDSEARAEDDDLRNLATTVEFVREQNENSPAGTTSNSKDLSLSCLGPSGKSEAQYTRLGSAEEVDNHLETMQTELENLRDVLRGEGYSIDANTLLGLFGADDPMSFGIPMNPELDPQRDRVEEERSSDNSNFVNARGELMAYTPSTSLLDFDDDIFLGTAGENSPSGRIENATGNTYYHDEDTLDLEDSKATLLASLAEANDANTA